MTNEEIIEELYAQAHRFGVFNEFINEINRLISVTKQTMYEIVTKVYYQFVNEGLIVDNLNNIE